MPSNDDSSPLRPPQPASGMAWVVVVAVAAAVAVGWWWWRPAPQPPAAPVAATPAPAAPAPASAPEAAASGPQYPVPADAAALPALAESDAYVAQAAAELLGAQAFARFVVPDGLLRRTVATVDNLARAQAPARLWPVQPTPGRFAVQAAQAGQEGGGAQAEAIAPGNAARYRPFIALAEAVPLDGAVALYTRLYPLLQTAYEELGYPRGHFNDRLVAVLDHLAAAPEPAGPLAVRLTRVEGEVPSTRPWVRYEFADARLQALSSGQKMLVRMGPENARRLKAVMAPLRQRLATLHQGRTPG